MKRQTRKQKYPTNTYLNFLAWVSHLQTDEYMKLLRACKTTQHKKQLLLDMLVEILDQFFLW